MKTTWNEDDELAALVMDRIRRCFIKQNERVYNQFIRTCLKNPDKEWVMTVTVEDFDLSILHNGWFVVAAKSPDSRPVQIFDAKMAFGRPNYSWDKYTVEEFLVPAIARFLVLEDLAEV